MTFPTAYWQAWDADAAFLPGATLPDESAGRLYAALVFLFYGTQVVLAEIAGRGLCIPSGRIEVGESPEQAAEREVWEETGGRLAASRLLGCYRLVRRGEHGRDRVRWCPVYVAEAARFEPIPEGSESRGVFLADLADIPSLYFTWDPLIEAVFACAAAYRTLGGPGIAAPFA